MPHYLIRGAWKRDASDGVRAIFAKSEGVARAAASKAGLLVLSVEVLDEGAPVREDAGEPSALSRLATQLNRDGRPDDAAAVMMQVYGMWADAGTSDSLCLRIPRYFLKAGRHDDAWRILNEMRVGRVRGNSLTDDRVPAAWVEWYKLAARILKAEKRRDHHRIMDAAAQVAGVLSEYWIVCDGVPRPGIVTRSDAVARIELITEEVLPSGVSATEWAEGVVPDEGNATLGRVIEIVSSLDVEIMRAGSVKW